MLVGSSAPSRLAALARPSWGSAIPGAEAAGSVSAAVTFSCWLRSRWIRRLALPSTTIPHKGGVPVGRAAGAARLGGIVQPIGGCGACDLCSKARTLCRAPYPPYSSAALVGWISEAHPPATLPLIDTVGPRSIQHHRERGAQPRQGPPGASMSAPAQARTTSQAGSLQNWSAISATRAWAKSAGPRTALRHTG